MGPTAGQRVPSKRKPAPPNRRQQETDSFETLVDDLSAAMAQAPAEAVDREIETWLGKICVALDLDRSAVYERDAPDKEVRTSHTWVRPGFPLFPRKYAPEKIANSTQWVLAGNQLVWSRPEEIPSEWKDTRRFVRRYGPKASAIFPMWAGDRVIGAASFGRFRSPREWNPRLLHQLALAVRVFGAAIERKQAEVTMRAARSELVLAQRRSMMGGLVASLAHELNQPLSAILSNLGGLARLLVRADPDPGTAAQAVENAIEDTRRAGEIVRRVRAVFKGGSSSKTAVDMIALAGEVTRLLGSEAILRKILVQIEARSGTPAVFGDRVLLEQCLLNLLLNAFDAVSEVDEKRRSVVLKIAAAPKDWIEISVHDRGCGIDPSIAGRLFDPFVTTKRQGMGLGLLVTRSIVEEHGGRIWTDSRREGGTTFTFTLPAAGGKRRHATELVGAP